MATVGEGEPRGVGGRTQPHPQSQKICDRGDLGSRVESFSRREGVLTHFDS